MQQSTRLLNASPNTATLNTKGVATTSAIDSPNITALTCTTRDDEGRDTEEVVRSPSPDQYSHTSYRNRRSQQNRVSILLPKWIARSSWEIQYGCSVSGWNLAFKTRNVVPWNSLLFKLAKSVDLEGLKRLFVTGQASPYDVDEYGTDALKVRAFTSMKGVIDAECCNSKRCVPPSFHIPPPKSYSNSVRSFSPHQVMALCKVSITVPFRGTWTRTTNSHTLYTR